VLRLHRAIKQFMQTHDNANVAFVCHAQSAELRCIVAVGNTSTLPHQQHQHCWGVIVAIMQRRVPSNLSKSMDPDESYGNAIVLTVLKDVVINNYLSVVTHADIVTRC
jgi:hypothetical protein